MLTEFTANLPQTDNFAELICQKTPLIDLRAPIEFQQGAFPNSTNLPLMDDEQRQKVGICYKQHGNQTAVKLGHKLVSGAVREARIQSWIDFLNQHPNAHLYCFRGGMRSKIAQQWLHDAGYSVPRLRGGYKALRQMLLQFLDQVPTQFTQAGIQSLLLCGRTGSGKTQLLNQLPQPLDLEALANHRGSAFGRQITNQPTQIDFENRLAAQLLEFLQHPLTYLVLEDEARNIGSVYLPQSLFDYLRSGPRVILHTTLESRLQITLQEYVLDAQQAYPSLAAWEAFMHKALLRIQKRLGGERYQRVIQQLNQAMEQQRTQNHVDGHLNWIHILLVEYYDPMYDYQLSKRQTPILLQGSEQEIREFLQERMAR